MADTVDRSVLETKAVSELREIAKSLDLKVSGLKKSQIIEMIARNGNGAPNPGSAPRQSSMPSVADGGGSSGSSEAGETQRAETSHEPRASAPAREIAPPMPAVEASGAPAAGQDGGSDGAGVRDDTASDERDRRGDDRSQRRRPQGRDNRPRPREKADPREGRGRRRRRGRGGGNLPHYLRDDHWEDLEAEDDPNAEVRTGILDLLPEGYGFLRTTGYLPGDKDVYVSASQVRRFHLRKGDSVTGSVRSPKDAEKYQALLRIHDINGLEPEMVQRRPRFADLTPLYPQQRLTLEQAENPRAITPRIIDLVAPIGKGQRGMIVSPPKAGKTTVMKEIANAVRANNPEVHLIVLLVDERPEEVTDMQRSVAGAEVIYSTFDRPSDDHSQVTELTMERA